MKKNIKKQSSLPKQERVFINEDNEKLYNYLKLLVTNTPKTKTDKYTIDISKLLSILDKEKYIDHEGAIALKKSLPLIKKNNGFEVMKVIYETLTK